MVEGSTCGLAGRLFRRIIFLVFLSWTSVDTASVVPSPAWTNSVDSAIGGARDSKSWVGMSIEGGFLLSRVWTSAMFEANFAKRWKLSMIGVSQVCLAGASEEGLLWIIRSDRIGRLDK